MTNRSKSQPDDVTERAQAAVRAFRQMQHGLTSYARAITGDKKTRIEIIASGPPRTDGTIIYYRPPIALGDKTPHDRFLCDKRDADTGLQSCPACKIREEILVNIYHEISHIAFGTFEDENFMAKASKVNPYLPALYNSLEDSRVDAKMFTARKGIRKMLEADTLNILREGVPDALGEYHKLNEAPINAQIALALYMQATGFSKWQEYFIKEVMSTVSDPLLAELVEQIREARNARSVYEVSKKILDRLRELGYYKTQKEQEEEDEAKQEESESQEQGEDQGNEEALSADDASDPSDQEDRDASGEKSDDRGDGDASPDDPDKGNPGEDDAPGGADPEEGTPGDNEQEEGPGEESGDDVPDLAGGNDEGSGDGSDSDRNEAGESEGGGGEASEESPEDQSTEAGSSDKEGEVEDGASGDGVSEVSYDAPRDDDGEPGSRPAEDNSKGGSSEDSDTADDSGDDGSSDSSDADSRSGGDQEDERNDGSESDSDAKQGDRERRQPDHGGEGEGDGGSTESNVLPDEQVSDDDNGDQGASEVPSEGTPDERSEGDTSFTGPEDGADGDDSSLPDPFESGADEGRGGIEADFRHGDEADVEAALDHGHSIKHEEVKETVAEEAAVATAVLQGKYFETPSVGVDEIEEHCYADDRTPGWDRSKLNSADLHWMGVECNTDIPESILGSALLKTRRIFSDNKNSSYQPNLRSGRVNSKVLGRRAWNDDDRLFGKKRIPAKRDYAVQVMVDISSSNFGDNLVRLKRSVIAQAELMHRVGVDFSIVAHSASAGRARRGYALHLHHVKDWSEPWNAETRTRAERIVPMGGNLDGHAMEYGRRRLESTSATDKILLYYTDGKMPAANHDEELEVLERQIKLAKRAGITLLGVGMDTDSPLRHGLDTVMVSTDDDIKSVVEHLGKRLAKMGR